MCVSRYTTSIRRQNCVKTRIKWSLDSWRDRCNFVRRHTWMDELEDSMSTLILFGFKDGICKSFLKIQTCNQVRNSKKVAFLLIQQYSLKHRQRYYLREPLFILWAAVIRRQAVRRFMACDWTWASWWHRWEREHIINNYTVLVCIN